MDLRPKPEKHKASKPCYGHSMASKINALIGRMYRVVNFGMKLQIPRQMSVRKPGKIQPLIAISSDPYEYGLHTITITTVNTERFLDKLPADAKGSFDALLCQ
jgi:hypothetical protein